MTVQKRSRFSQDFAVWAIFRFNLTSLMLPTTVFSRDGFCTSTLLLQLCPMCQFTRYNRYEHKNVPAKQLLVYENVSHRVGTPVRFKLCWFGCNPNRCG